MMQMASTFGSNYANLSLSPLPPPQNQLKEETIMNKGSCANTLMADSLASLYNSDQNQTHNSSKSSNSIPMSATALLQKAAQMGSTKSNPALFGKSTTVGLMNSSSSSSASPSANHLSFNNPFTQNRSELHQVFGKKQNQINVNPTMKEASANKIMNFSSSTSALMNLHSGLRGVDQNSLTRDFLGMGGGDDSGGGGGGPMFFPPELANLASMSSAMVLSHFGSSHQLS